MNDTMSESTPPESSSSESGRSGSPNTKGGKTVTRQNFSMHPDLMKAIISATSQLGTERTNAIIDDRAKRVTYSKVVAALAWILYKDYLTPDGQITPAFRYLIASYEATRFERPDDAVDPETIMANRRRYAAALAEEAGFSPVDDEDEIDRGMIPLAFETTLLSPTPPDDTFRSSHLSDGRPRLPDEPRQTTPEESDDA